MSTIHFPSKEAIVAYLQKSPLTSDRYLSEKKIIDTIAAVFANKEKELQGVGRGVMSALYDLNEKIGLPQIALLRIQMRLTQALHDCAEGKPIELE